MPTLSTGAGNRRKRSGRSGSPPGPCTVECRWSTTEDQLDHDGACCQNCACSRLRATDEVEDQNDQKDDDEDPYQSVTRSGDREHFSPPRSCWIRNVPRAGRIYSHVRCVVPPFSSPSARGGRLVGQGNSGVHNDFATGSFGNMPSGLDSVILRVKGEEGALNPLDLDGRVVPALYDMNIAISHAVAVPASSAGQTPPSVPPAREERGNS